MAAVDIISIAFPLLDSVVLTISYSSICRKAMAHKANRLLRRWVSSLPLALTYRLPERF